MQANAIIAYPRPFRLILKDKSENWTPTLQEIESGTYDYVRLHRISTSIDIGLADPYCLYVTFDGSLILPSLPELLPMEKAAARVNRLLGELLLGGVYCESLYPADLDSCIVYNTGYFRPLGRTKSLDGEARMALRAKCAAPLQRIRLLNPEMITAWEFHEGLKNGRTISKAIPNFSPDFLLHAVTSFIVGDSANCLTNSWVCIEQILFHLWQEHIVLRPSSNGTEISGRSEFLRDYRTWTSATQIELLYQKGIIAESLYALLNRARKARNSLVHKGEIPSKLSAEAALDGVWHLLSPFSTHGDAIFLEYLAQFKRRDPITRGIQALTVKVDQDWEKCIWFGPLPPIPGDKEWGDRKYEKVSFIKDQVTPGQ